MTDNSKSKELFDFILQNVLQNFTLDEDEMVQIQKLINEGARADYITDDGLDALTSLYYYIYIMTRQQFSYVGSNHTFEKDLLENSIHLTDLLVRAGADINRKVPGIRGKNLSPIEIAARVENGAPLIQKLLDLDATPTNESMYNAIIANSLANVKMLNESNIFDKSDGQFTHMAMFHKDTSILNYLLQNEYKFQSNIAHLINDKKWNTILVLLDYIKITPTQWRRILNSATTDACSQDTLDLISKYIMAGMYLDLDENIEINGHNLYYYVKRKCPIGQTQKQLVQSLSHLQTPELTKKYENEDRILHQSKERSERAQALERKRSRQSNTNQHLPFKKRKYANRELKTLIYDTLYELTWMIQDDKTKNNDFELVKNELADLNQQFLGPNYQPSCASIEFIKALISFDKLELPKDRWALHEEDVLRTWDLYMKANFFPYLSAPIVILMLENIENDDKELSAIMTFVKYQWDILYEYCPYKSGYNNMTSFLLKEAPNCNCHCVTVLLLATADCLGLFPKYITARRTKRHTYVVTHRGLAVEGTRRAQTVIRDLRDYDPTIGLIRSVKEFFETSNLHIKQVRNLKNQQVPETLKDAVSFGNALKIHATDPKITDTEFVYKWLHMFANIKVYLRKTDEHNEEYMRLYAEYLLQYFENLNSHLFRWGQVPDYEGNLSQIWSNISNEDPYRALFVLAFLYYLKIEWVVDDHYAREKIFNKTDIIQATYKQFVEYLQILSSKMQKLNRIDDQRFKNAAYTVLQKIKSSFDEWEFPTNQIESTLNLLS